MNQQIVEYLSHNKEQYSQEVLVDQLKLAGHAEEEIVAAVEQVYGTKMPVAPNAPVKYAGFWVRFVALSVDAILIVYLPGYILVTILNQFESENGGVRILFSFIPGLLPVILAIYFVLMTYRYQATLGKMLVGIRVKSQKGGDLNFWRIVLRETIGKYLSFGFFHIGFIMAAFTKNKRALHDFMAQSIVAYKEGKQKSWQRYVSIAVGVLIGGYILILAIIFGLAGFANSLYS